MGSVKAEIQKAVEAELKRFLSTRRLTSYEPPSPSPSSLLPFFLVLLPLLLVALYVFYRFQTVCSSRSRSSSSIPKRMVRCASEVYGIRKDPLNRAERMV